MYFFVAIFALISLLQDEKIKAALAHRSHRTRKTFFRRAKHEMLIEKYERGEDEQYFLGRQGFLFTFIRECFSLRPRKRILSLLKSYHAQMYVALGSVCLVNFLNYAGFLFIPIIAIANHLNLSQIAILFAVMKAPYLVNIFLGKRGDKYNKKLIIALILVFMSLFYIMLGINDDFWMILLLTFAISLAISLLNPLTSALVSSYTHQQHKGVMTGAKDFIAEIGEMLGSLGFGAVIALIGIKTGFIVIGIALFALGMYLFMKKLLQHYHSKASLNTST
jgi:MFS family permease